MNITDLQTNHYQIVATYVNSFFPNRLAWRVAQEADGSKSSRSQDVQIQLLTAIYGRNPVDGKM